MQIDFRQSNSCSVRDSLELWYAIPGLYTLHNFMILGTEAPGFPGCSCYKLKKISTNLKRILII